MEVNLQNPEIICQNCGSVNDYEVILKSDQATAWCNRCTKFIKNIPYKPPTLYFGKYKDRLISSMLEKEEVEYLQWASTQLWCKKVLKRQIEDHFKTL